MNAEPARVERTKRSLKSRRNCTAGEASEPNVAVAIMHSAIGLQGAVVVRVVAVAVAVVVTTPVVAVVAVVTVETMSVTATVAVSPPPVPDIGMTVVLAGAVFEMARESTELVVPPADGVTGLGLKPPLTPDGSVGAARVTAELKAPIDCTVTVIAPTPPGLTVRLAGLAERVNVGAVVGVVAVVVVVVVTAVTVNVPLAAFPVLPTARTV